MCMIPNKKLEGTMMMVIVIVLTGVKIEIVVPGKVMMGDHWGAGGEEADGDRKGGAGPEGRHILLAVTEKKRGSLRKGIVPDGLVQLQIQKYLFQ